MLTIAHSVSIALFLVVNLDWHDNVPSPSCTSVSGLSFARRYGFFSPLWLTALRFHYFPVLWLDVFVVS
jgi:hypothetical protein